MSDALGYKGKRVIITGCFSGMGHAAAKLLLDLGAEVHGFDMKECDLPLASFTKIDLRDRASIEAGALGLTGDEVTGGLSVALRQQVEAVVDDRLLPWPELEAAWADVFIEHQEPIRLEGCSEPIEGRLQLRKMVKR